MEAEERFSKIVSNEQSPFLERFERYKNNMEANWISVKDRLPEEGQRVLIHTEREHQSSPTEIIGYTRIYGKDGEHLMWHSWDAHEDEDLFVTHWMPLPSPPQLKSETLKGE